MKIPIKILPLFLSLANRGGGMVFQFISVWMIAKATGVVGVGFYSYYTAWMMVLAALAGFGSATYTMRTISVYAKDNNHAAIRMYLKKMALLLLVSGVSMTVFIFGISKLLVNWWIWSDAVIHQVIWASLGAVAFMLMRLMSETLKALSLLNTSMVIESMLIPFLLIVFCSAVVLYGVALNIEVLIAVHIVLMVLGALLMLVYIIRRTLHEVQADSPHVDVGLWNQGMLPMWGSSLLGMLFLNMPMLLLPNFASPEEMGLFAIAYRFINICIVLLIVVSGIYGPRFAQEYADSDANALRSSLAQTRWYSMALYAPLFIAFISFPEWVMGLFGASFRQGADLLLAMAIGQLVYASTGLAGLMLNMIHREKEEFWISLGATILMAALITGFGSHWSALGVAIGFGIGLGVKNLISWYMVNQYLLTIKIPSKLVTTE